MEFKAGDRVKPKPNLSHGTWTGTVSHHNGRLVYCVRDDGKSGDRGDGYWTIISSDLILITNDTQRVTPPQQPTLSISAADVFEQQQRLAKEMKSRLAVEQLLQDGVVTKEEFDYEAHEAYIKSIGG